MNRNVFGESKQCGVARSPSQDGQSIEEEDIVLIDCEASQSTTQRVAGEIGRGAGDGDMRYLFARQGAKLEELCKAVTAQGKMLQYLAKEGGYQSNGARKPVFPIKSMNDFNDMDEAMREDDEFKSAVVRKFLINAWRLNF